MRFRLSLKQLFLFGILASPIISIWLLASQGRHWAMSALFVQLLSATVLFLMCLLFGASDQLAKRIYGRRRLKTRQRPVPVASPSVENAPQPGGSVLPDDVQPPES